MAAAFTFAAGGDDGRDELALLPSTDCGAAGRAACLFASLAPPATATVGHAPASERAPLILRGRETGRVGGGEKKGV